MKTLWFRYWIIPIILSLWKSQQNLVLNKGIRCFLHERIDNFEFKSWMIPNCLWVWEELNKPILFWTYIWECKQNPPCVKNMCRFDVQKSWLTRLIDLLFHVHWGLPGFFHPGGSQKSMLTFVWSLEPKKTFPPNTTSTVSAPNMSRKLVYFRLLDQLSPGIGRWEFSSGVWHRAVWMQPLCLWQVSNEKTPGCLGYLGDYNKPWNKDPY